MHRPTAFLKLLLNDGFDGAVVAASAAANTGVSVDDVHLVALGDSLNGAVVSAGAALNASVSNSVCHDNFLHMFLVSPRVTINNIIARISENAIPIFKFLRIFFP